jgi:hypothetical protein
MKGQRPTVPAELSQDQKYKASIDEDNSIAGKVFCIFTFNIKKEAA